MVCLSQIGIAQHSAKIIDSKSGEVIPLANISIGTENVVSNAEGFFSVPEIDSNVRIAVTSMGYVGKSMTVDQLESANFVVRLEPTIYELDDVKVQRPDANTIMANVRQNLKKHYQNQNSASKDMIFIRETQRFNPLVMDFEITKSTGFTKKSLQQANSELASFSNVMKEHPPKAFTDMLGNLYTPVASPSKLHVVKATKLMDDSRGTSIDQIQSKLTTTILKHLDTMKYYRIKSGMIGSRDTVSLRKDFKKKKKKAPKSELINSKTSLSSFLTQNKFTEDSKATYVTNPALYSYTYEGATFMDNDLVYILTFGPRKSKAKYIGKLYVSAEDYAVLRADYSLDKGKTEGGVNLKWVLGIKASENVANGTTIFKQNTSGNGYYLQYASVEEGQYLYVNRPLKFIELSKEERDVVAFDIKVEGNMVEKTEFLNMSRSDVNQSEISAALEPDFKYQVLRRYDPAIWSAYSAIEPLEEMKRFTVPE